MEERKFRPHIRDTLISDQCPDQNHEVVNLSARDVSQEEWTCLGQGKTENYFPPQIKIEHVFDNRFIAPSQQFYGNSSSFETPVSDHSVFEDERYRSMENQTLLESNVGKLKSEEENSNHSNVVNNDIQGSDETRRLYDNCDYDANDNDDDDESHQLDQGFVNDDIKVGKNDDTDTDRGYSWVIVCASFFNAFIIDGIGSCFGLLFPEVVRKFDTSAFVASFAGSCYIALMLMGSISAELSIRFGVRGICLVGGLLASISFAVSAYSTNIVWFILTYGLLAGCSCGLVFLPSILIVNSYFDKKRGIANGIITSGSGVGLLVLGPFVTFLLETYGLEGTVLILSGVLLNICVFSMLYRPHPTTQVYQRRKKELVKPGRVSKINTEQSERLRLPNEDNKQCGRDIVMNGVHCTVDTGDCPDGKNPLCSPTDQAFMLQNIHTVPVPLVSEVINKLFRRNHSQSAGNLNCSPDILRTKSLGRVNEKVYPIGICISDIDPISTANHRRLFLPDGAYMDKISASSSCPTIIPSFKPPKLHHSVHSLHQAYCDSVSNLRKEGLDLEKVASLNAPFHVNDETPLGYTLKQLLTSPKFYVFCLGAGLIQLGFPIAATFLADYAYQYGMSHYHSAVLMMLLGSTTVIGRLFAGFLASFHHDPLTMNNVALLLASITCFFSPLYTEFWSLCLLAILFGFFLGFFPPLQPLIIVDYFGIGSLTSAFGFLTTLKGLASMLGPPLAGFVYDVSGDYRMCFVYAGAVLLASALVHWLIPVCGRRRG